MDKALATSPGNVPTAMPPTKSSEAPMPLPSVLLGLCLLAWASVSAIESNFAILAFHLIFGFIAILIVRYLSKNNYVLNILLAAMLIRTAASIIAYYTSPDLAFRYATGTNEDSIRFYEASHYTLEISLISFAEPGFPLVNHFVTAFAQKMGGAHYLVSTQFVLWFGSLLPAVVYMMVKEEIGNVKAAPIVAGLLAIQPLAVAFSTGLMRDAVIAGLGWTLVLLVLRIRRPGLFFKAHTAAAIVAATIAVATMRVISSLTFLVISLGAYFIFNNDKKSPAITRRSAILLGSALLAILLVIALTRIDKIMTMLDYANSSRGGALAEFSDLGDINENGLTQRLWTISPLLLILISPLQIMQPIPFFLWSPPPWIGGPARFVDILNGLGGLMNQLLFGLFIIALNHWWKNKRWGEFCFCGLYVFFAGWVNLIGLGQVRYMMAHAYPLYMYSVVIGYQSFKDDQKAFARSSGYWIIGLLIMYVLYSVMIFLR